MDDHELNALVARGLGWKQGWKNNPDGWINPRGGYDDLRDYCHDIKAAWEIVEDQRKKGYFRMFQDREFMGHGSRLGYVCVLGVPNSTKFVEEWADTAPMAICLAFLKLKSK